jgi:hypothetical protein
MIKVVNFLMFFCVILSINQGFSQQLTYDFVVPLPPESSDLMAIPPKLFGVYLDTATDQKITVKQRGIFMSKTVYGQLPVSLVDTSSVYKVRNQSIFGIVENDSLPCFKKDSLYYFGMVKSSEIFSFNGDNSMRKLDENQDDYSYFICSKENSYWLPMILRFQDDKLSIERPLFEDMKNPFENIVVKFHEKKNQLTFVHLNPSLEEWKTIDMSTYFGDKQDFIQK